MSLKDTLTEDMKNAMRAKDSVTLGTLRMLLAAIKKKEIDTKTTLEDGEVLKAIQTQIKQRRDSIAAFDKGGREELAAQEKVELAILEKYLPQQMSQEELQALVKQAVAETGASSPKDMGRVMKVVLEKAENRADGKVVSQLVQAALKS